MKKMRNNLDERQEQNLLKIEHRGCWLAFWGLLASLIVQEIINADIKAMAGEWIVFMCLALYLFAGCMKYGIWDRRLKPNTRTSVLTSALAALVVGVMNFFRYWHLYPDKMVGAAAASAFVAVFTFVLCFVVLMISVSAYKNRKKKLEQPEEDEMSM